jgi:hypothetical protein
MSQTKVVEKIKTFILCLKTSHPPPENDAIYEIMWKKMIEPNSPQYMVRRMRIFYWLTKATDKQSVFCNTSTY